MLRGLSPVAEGFVGDDLLGYGRFDKTIEHVLFCQEADRVKFLLKSSRAMEGWLEEA